MSNLRVSAAAALLLAACGDSTEATPALRVKEMTYTLAYGPDSFTSRFVPTYDADGFITKIDRELEGQARGSAAFAYEEGNLVSITIGHFNGNAVYEYAYTDGRLTGFQRRADAEVLESATYETHPDDPRLVTSMTPFEGATPVRTMYDEELRLVTVDGGSYRADYQYEDGRLTGTLWRSVGDGANPADENLVSYEYRGDKVVGLRDENGGCTAAYNGGGDLATFVCEYFGQTDTITYVLESGDIVGPEIQPGFPGFDFRGRSLGYELRPGLAISPVALF